MTRKIAVPLNPDQALEWIEQPENIPFIEISTSLIKIAVGLGRRYRISCWDAAIVAAAEALGATTLFSEDLNHGQSHGTVRVRNPFV